MSEVSIQQDATEEVEEIVVEETVEETVDTKPLSQRDEVIERIKAKRTPDVDDEIIESDEEEIVEELEQLPETIKIKVDGVEREVPRDSVIESGIRTLQKESVADMRLREAAARKQELDQREKALMDRLEALGKESSESDTSDYKRKFADALIEDEEQAATMFAESAQRVANLEQKLSEIYEDVALSREFVETTQQSEKSRLMGVFKREYPSIAGDPHLSMKANERTVEIMRDNPDMSHEDVVLQAGKDVSEYISTLAGGATVEDTTVVKRNMPKAVKRAAGRQPPKKEPKPKTTADIIREMQERRSPLK